MYAIALIAHSWLRWAALAGSIGATVTSWRRGVTGRWGLLLTAALDIQLLIGLVLYLVLSPFTAGVRANPDVVMRDPTLRFWNVDHLATMLVAAILVHAGGRLARRARSPQAKRWRLLVCLGTATLLMIAGTPWPALEYGRTWFRWSGL